MKGLIATTLNKMVYLVAQKIKMQRVFTSKWYFFIAVFMFSSCARQCTESALSDVEISDPDLLILEMRMYKEYSGQSPVSQNLIVWVRDKNEQALTLLNGSVQVNGKKMTINRSLITKLPYYESGNTVDISDDKSYTVNVELADGETYESTIEIPKGNVTGIKAPSYHDPSQPLTVSWDAINRNYQAEFSWEKQIAQDTTVLKKSGSFVLSGESSKTFDPGFFVDPDGEVTEVRFWIGTETTGNVNSAFRNESFFEAQFWAVSTVTMQKPI